MNKPAWIVTVLVLTSAAVATLPVMAQSQADPVSVEDITGLNGKLAAVNKISSKARKKLAARRVIREAESLIKQYPSAANRYEVLSILFRGQQVLVSLDNSVTNRKTFLATCEKLAAAPDAYAALRLDADVLLTQARSARLGGDSRARSDALRPLVRRYQDTEVEAKVIRIAMIMALESGNNRLVNDLRKVIAERLPGDREMISFLRDRLGGQVFGAPFTGTFQQTDKSIIRFPMDYLGTTTAVYFWSKEDGGLEDLKELAEAWKKILADPEKAAAGRLRFVSINVDDLPDAGESIIREHGLDWPVLHLQGGRDNAIYKTYCRHDPRVVTVSPTGYAAIFLTSSRSSRGYERNLQSWLARQWTRPGYNSQLQSLFAGEFLIMTPQGEFDPAAPPEWTAAAADVSRTTDRLPRTADSVPEEKLRAIQACFLHPPVRYRTPFDQLRANYEKADALCRGVIAAHGSAADLWIVRNRRITALLALWKLRGESQYFADAVKEATVAVEAGYPPGTDVIARFCLARESLRNADHNAESVIRDFVEAHDKKGSGPVLAAGSLLALDIANRKLHEEYRRSFLDQYAASPTMWTATAFLLDRYHRYWMYHPPFTAGWTYGRRQGHFLAIGDPEDAKRTLQLELKTLEGETVRFPVQDDGKWTVISFASSAEGSAYLSRYGSFVEQRPVDDVNLVTAVLNDNAEVARQALEARKRPDTFPTMLVPGGMQNPVVRQLGILAEEKKPDLVLLRPDGSIAAALSGLTMSSQHGNVIQNILELHDEKSVDEALARGDLEEARRRAFLFAPIEEPAPPDAKPKPPQKISNPHLRSRARVYLAMGNLEAAYKDAEQAYLAVNSRAGWLSLRTDDLEETEALKATILTALEQAGSQD